jgi:putative oxidoreductase
MNHLTKTQTLVSWLCQIGVAVILVQTLFFKFTGAEESVYIFSTLGAEPWGRIGSGVIELIASILLLAPGTIPIGALLTMGVMAGAIMSHLTILGIEIMGDGGLLFGLALTAFTGSAVVLAIRRGQLPIVGRYLEMA